MDMNHRVMEITLLSAKDLSKVNLLTRMDVYAVVTITGGNKTASQKIKTSVDHEGDANPTWNFPMKFTIDDAELQMNRLMLNFKLLCQRALGDKEVGQVRVALKELSQTKGNSDGKVFLSYQVRKPGGQSKGQISFSCRFMGKPVAAPLYEPAIPELSTTGKHENQPNMAYQASPSSLYPPPGTYPPLGAYGNPGGIGVYPPVTVNPSQPTGVYPPPNSYEGPGKTGAHPPATAYPPQLAGGYPPPDPHWGPGNTGVYPPVTAYPPQPPGVYPPQNSFEGPGKTGVYPPATAYPPQPAGDYPPADPHGGPGKIGVYPPATAYPPQPAGVYGPQQHTTAYGYPPPPQAGYAPPPVAKPTKKSNNLGLGLGAGLLGGLLLGDLVSDNVCSGGFDF